MKHIHKLIGTAMLTLAAFILMIGCSTPQDKRWDPNPSPSTAFLKAGGTVPDSLAAGNAADYDVTASNAGPGKSQPDLLKTGRYLWRASEANPQDVERLLSTPEGEALYRDFLTWASDNWKDRNELYIAPAIGVRSVDIDAAFAGFDPTLALRNFSPGKDVNATYWTAMLGWKHSLAKPSKRMAGSDWGLDLAVSGYNAEASVTEGNAFPVYVADVDFEGAQIRLYLYKRWRLDKPSESETARWTSLDDVKGTSKWLLTVAGGPVIDVGNGKLTTSMASDSFSGKTTGGVGAKVELLRTWESKWGHEMGFGPFVDVTYVGDRELRTPDAKAKLGGLGALFGVEFNIRF